MKKLLFLFTLALLAFNATAQTQQVASGYSSWTNQKNTGASTIYSRDTLINLDTIIVPLGSMIELRKLDVIIRCDSISGATAGTAYLQLANTGPNSSLTDNQVMWYNASSATLDGAGRTQYRLTADWSSGRARLFIVTPNSTARRMMITYFAVAKRWSRP
mgnify:CR=1 FL=1